MGGKALFGRVHAGMMPCPGEPGHHPRVAPPCPN